MVWLIFYLLGVLFKSIAWAASGGKSDAPILVWNHPKAVAKLLAPGEEDTLVYCGRGGWEHRMYRYYLSQIVYIYLTGERILVVSKNHGTHEFNHATLQLNTNESTGSLDLLGPADSVYLGYVPVEGIRVIVSAVNERRRREVIDNNSETAS